MHRNVVKVAAKVAVAAAGGGDVGNALKAAYDDTLKEDVPADLLALLGKLD